MEELKHKVDDLANIDKQILRDLSAFSGSVSQFQATVLTLSNTVAGLSKEVEFLREDIKDTQSMKKDIGELQRQQAQNKGSYLAVVAIGSSIISLAGVITAIVAVIAKHG